MNDPNKVINVNLSSLLSLKAELLRKQAEVSKAKIAQSTSSNQEQEYTSHKQSSNENDDDTVSAKKKDKKKRSKKIEKTNEVTVYEHEDSVMLEKSRRTLEAKAKFYEKMQKTGGKLNTDDNCLVMFNKKKQDDKQHDNGNSLETICSSSESSSDKSDSDHPDDPDDEWVEYTDCLGRTRTCLKRDLEEAKRKDAALAASMPERLDQSKANWMIDTIGSNNQTFEDNQEDFNDMIGPLPPSSVFSDGVSHMSKLEEQKTNWERKELENLDKSEIHYQDVFFDEARQHGVGYYAFSTDEEERRKQQQELEKARQETLDEQKRRQALKEQREKIIAERVLAAKNRQRARLGLPPLEKDPENESKESQAEKTNETKEERKARKKLEKLEKKKQLEEEEKEKERLQHIRPWDKEKEGVTANTNDEIEEEWSYKPEREPMSQEQWNEHKRKERIAEFAPPPPAPENFPKRTNFRSATNTIPERNYNNVPPPPENTGFSKYQSTKTAKVFKRRYCSEASQALDEEAPSSAKTGVCIPPPSNLEDFYLPSQNKKAKSTQELEKSIEAGLRFLRNNSDKEMSTTKSSWAAKADY